MTAEELAELARLDAVATQLQTLVDDLRESAKNGVMAGILRAASESPDVAALRKALNENADKLAAAREREARLREALERIVVESERCGKRDYYWNEARGALTAEGK